MTKAIFFDMDGTLFKTKSILGTALEQTFEALREKELWQGATPLEQYYAIMGVPLPVVWQQLCPNFEEELRQQCNELFHKHLITAILQGEGEIYEGVHALLSTLKGKYPLFVTSNGEVAYLQAIVKVFELEQYFTAVYSIQQIDSLDKGQLVALAKSQHQVTEGFVVGDRLSDFRAAGANDLRSIGVRFDFAQEEELQQADVIVEELSQILGIIQ